MREEQAMAAENMTAAGNETDTLTQEEGASVEAPAEVEIP